MGVYGERKRKIIEVIQKLADDGKQPRADLLVQKIANVWQLRTQTVAKYFKDLENEGLIKLSLGCVVLCETEPSSVLSEDELRILEG